MSDETITRCPFCGNTDIGIGTSKQYTTWSARASCKRCGIHGPSRSAVNRSDAVRYARQAWNNRVPVPELAGTHPVTVYFGNDADAGEFIALMQQAKPGLVARKL